MLLFVCFDCVQQQRALRTTHRLHMDISICGKCNTLSLFVLGFLEPIANGAPPLSVFHPSTHNPHLQIFETGGFTQKLLLYNFVQNWQIFLQSIQFD